MNGKVTAVASLRLVIIAVVFISLLLSSGVTADIQDKSNSSAKAPLPDNGEDSNCLEFTKCFGEEDFVYVNVNGFDEIRHNDSNGIVYGNSRTYDDNKPSLPTFFVNIAVPKTMKATDIDIIDVERTELSRTFKLRVYKPSDSNPKISNTGAPEVFSSSKRYPDTDLKLLRQYDNHGQPIITVMIYPIQYLPGGTITQIKSITFRVIGVDGYVCKSMISPKWPQERIDKFADEVRGRVINPEDVHLTVPSNDADSRSSRLP